MSANMANSAIHPFGVDKWVVSWTQAFAVHTCVVVPHGECLRVKADVMLFAGNTVWSISERVRGVREDALYKSTLPLPLHQLHWLPIQQHITYKLCFLVHFVHIGGEWKCGTWKYGTIKITGVDNARHEIAAPNNRGEKCEKSSYGTHARPSLILLLYTRKCTSNSTKTAEYTLKSTKRQIKP